MPRQLVSLALLFTVAGASASGIGGVEVERSAGAETCPDAGALDALIAEVRGHAEHAPAAYRVRFEHRDAMFHAKIDSRNGTATRSLMDSGESCAALARATAVTLALLIDADTTEKSSPPGPEAPPREPPRAAPSAAPAPGVALLDTLPAAATPQARVAVIPYLGPAVVTGVVRPVAPAFAAGVGLARRQLRLSAGAVWVIPGDVELGPGAVRTSLVAAALDACVTALRPEPARFELCSGLLAGRVFAEARGYSTNVERSRAWYAFPFGLAASVESAPFAVQAGGAALVPVRRQDFQIDGIGVAYASPPVGGHVWIRVMTVVPW